MSLGSIDRVFEGTHRDLLRWHAHLYSKFFFEGKDVKWMFKMVALSVNTRTRSISSPECNCLYNELRRETHIEECHRNGRHEVVEDRFGVLKSGLFLCLEPCSLVSAPYYFFVAKRITFAIAHQSNVSFLELRWLCCSAASREQHHESGNTRRTRGPQIISDGIWRC